MKKLKVLTENCIGCGACVGIDPEHFDFNDDGLSHVISEENLESEALQNAIESCPVSIISIEEENEDEDFEVVILELKQDENGEMVLDTVTDEKLAEKVFNEFKARNEDEE